MNAVYLTLFLSHRGSLQQWKEAGILGREMEPYLALLMAGACRKVQIFSYGTKDVFLLESLRNKDPRYCNIDLLTPHYSVSWSLPLSILWSLFGPIVHYRKLSQSDALKTNQINGSWSAVITYFITGKPVYLRMGYLLSRRFALNGQLIRHWLARAVEAIGFRYAKMIIFTPKEVERVLGEKGISSKSVHLPSYVNVDLFRPKTTYDFTQPIVTICRLTSQKNLGNLIRACNMLGRRLIIYGTGPDEAALKKLVAELQADVIFAGQVEHDVLPGKLRDHSIFILPSYHEGLPKSLMEAMACGLICAGTNIPGITDLIEDGVTGYLINGNQPADIATALLRILKDRDESIGQAAHKLISQQFCLDRHVARESLLYADIK